jgi:hypothetical protein
VAFCVDQTDHEHTAFIARGALGRVKPFTRLAPNCAGSVEKRRAAMGLT